MEKPQAKNQTGPKTLTKDQIAELAMKERLLRVVNSASKDNQPKKSEGKKPSA